MNSNRVVIEKREIFSYPSKTELFRPSKCYPEYHWGKEYISSSENPIYDMVRNSLLLMEYDKEHFNMPDWNPFGNVVKPGDTVLIKPNLVMDYNPNKGNTDCLYTNPSIVAAITDYVIIALKGRGKIIIGDAPMQECKFEKLISDSGYKDLVSFYHSALDSIDVQLVDFRDLKTEIINNEYHQSINKDSKGIEVELNSNSEFWNMSNKQSQALRVTNYDSSIMHEHHNKQKSEYYVCKYVLESDVIINIPKPKTHRKAGVTIALKNMVGINSRKEYLPHHTKGAIKEGGDEYYYNNYIKKITSDLLDKKNRLIKMNYHKRAKVIYNISRFFSKIFTFTYKDTYREGSWFGNDTISKTIVDLNKIVLYADKQGVIRDKKQRKYFAIGDMIVSGEGEGPVAPSPKEVGMIVCSENPVAFDVVIATIMGAKIEMISTITHALHPCGSLKLISDSAIQIISNDKRWDKKDYKFLDGESILFFKPTTGWIPAFKTE